MNNLLLLIETLETKIQYVDKLNTAISKSPVVWHIQHILLTTRRIIQAIESSNPENYTWKFNLTRDIILAFKKIPRGKGKAPKSVLPNETLLSSALILEIEALKSKIKVLDSLHANHYFDHPYFGNLNLKATRKFLEIHTKHHIAIIDDIIK